MKHMHYDEADVSAIHAFAGNNSVKLREDQGIFAARQLDYVKARTYERKIPVMGALQLVPQESDAPEWAETITYRSFDMVGMAKIIANYADDLPRADVTGTEEIVPVRTIGDSYGYNVNELNASIALGANLPERKATAARRAIEIKLAQIALIGDAKHGLQGMATHKNMGETSGNMTTDWANPSTTAVQIVADVDVMWIAILTQSGGVHTPNTLALPLTAYAAMTSKYVADTGGKSAYDVVRSKYPGMTIIGLPELNENGVHTNSRAIIGEFSVENAALETVMPFNQLPAQARNLELVVPCMARTGGVSMHYPLAFTYVKDI